MNIKRFISAFVVLFIFMFAYETVVHGKLLTNLYLETPTLWRSYDQMLAFIPFNISIMGLLAFFVTFAFTRFFATGGAQNGLRFGFYIGLLSALQAAGAYYYLPISATLATIWFFVNLIESTMGGLLIGSIYKK